MHTQEDLQQQLRSAVARFWKTRQAKARKQSGKSGTQDAGSRSMVTGGKQMDGFISCSRIVQEEVIPASAIDTRGTMLLACFHTEEN
ncbi:MAG: PaeR7I family type II restriction endonuclease [Spirochaetia bacterium]